KQSKMSALKLKAAAISVLALNGLGTPEDENAVSEAIEKLGANLKTATDSLAAEKAAKEALQMKLDAQAAATAAALVDGAIADGKLGADSREHWLEIAKANPELAAKTIGALPGKTSLSAQVSNPAAGAAAGGVKTQEDFLKLSHDEQLKFKAEHPDEYVKLFA